MTLPTQSPGDTTSTSMIGSSSLTPDALLDAGDVLLRHHAADDLAHELVAGTRRVGFHSQLHAGELARAARLLLVRVIDLGRARQRLAVGHLRRADIDLDLVGALEDLDQ